MTVEIPLTRGYVALVDDEDAARVLEHRWQALVTGRYVYAKTDAPRKEGGKARCIYLHRFIVGAPPDAQVDHINHNCLDNRRENLRICSCAENHRNIAKRVRPASSRYKGVYWHRGSQKWRAQISCAGEWHHLGMYTDEEAAARAYDAAARERFGEFAQVNFT
jgi:hypothetical protein